MKDFSIQQYPLKEPLPRIKRHDQLPAGFRQLGLCLDSIDGPNFEDVYAFVQQGKYLSILKAGTRNIKNIGPKYRCFQFDFPLKALSWFPQALEEFRKPPIAGGLPAGAMISADENVDGEMLAVGSTTDGYDLTNWSRNSHTASPGYYDPMHLSLKWEFLYHHGFLDLWKRLGEYYESGQY